MARIDVSKSNFLARNDLPPVVWPLQQVLPKVAAVAEEEIASSRLSLEEEIDKFHFEKEGEVPGKPLELSDSEAGFDRFSASYSPRLIVGRVDPSSEDEEEDMDLKKGNSLKGLLANRNKGSSSRQAPRSQVPLSLPPLPTPPLVSLGLHAMKDLKKKRTVHELEEGEVVPPKGTKQQKVAKDPKDRRSTSVDSREEHDLVEVLLQQRTWSPGLKVDGVPIPWNSSVREFQRGHSHHVAKAL